MRVRELQDEIIRLKKEKDFCILVHAYQSPELLEIADFVGDSYGLSVKAAEAPQKNIIMCGVRFMAETVKLLSPEKHAFLANPAAGCPMADQLDKYLLQGMKEKFPDHTVVAYINTTSELKTVTDVCVTSSSALKICKAIDNDKILFVPDSNLGSWVAEQIPEKKFEFFHGGCPTHFRVTKADVERARAEHPEALLLVHPECRTEVTNLSDYAGSTTGIMAYAKNSDAKEFIIGTELSIVWHLQNECPDKKFYPLSKDLMCHNMRITTLNDVLKTIQGTGGEEIFLSDEVLRDAKKPIEKMIELGG